MWYLFLMKAPPKSSRSSVWQTYARYSLRYPWLLAGVIIGGLHGAGGDDSGSDIPQEFL